MSNKIVIGVDLDGTTANIHDAWLGTFNAAKGTNYTKEEWTDWDCFNPTIENPGQFFKELLAHLHPSVYDVAPPYPKMRETIAALAAMPDVTLVCVTTNPSARNDEFSVAKQAWLDSHAPDLANGVIFAKNKSGRGLDFLIDDAPHNTANVVDYTPILIERPWNSRVQCEHRISGWENALEVILPIIEAKRAEKAIAAGLPAKTASSPQKVSSGRDIRD